MTNHIEWADAQLAAESAQITEEHSLADPYGTDNDRPALIMDTGSSLIAIEGDEAEMHRLIETLTHLVDNYDWSKKVTK